MLTVEQARDEMLDAFWTQWKAAGNLVVGYVPEVVWDMDEQLDAASPRSDRYWARVSVTHDDSRQRTFGDGSTGQRYEQTGLVMVQMFAPRSITQSVTKLEEMGTLVQDAYQAKRTPGGVWFRRARLQEVPQQPGSPWHQMNLSVNFTYDVRADVLFTPFLAWFVGTYGLEFPGQLDTIVNTTLPGVL